MWRGKLKCEEFCGSHLSQCGVLQSTQDVFGPLSITCCLTQQEDGQRGGFGPLGDVDQLLQTRHTQCYVLGRHTSVMESVEGHLGSWLSQRLSSQSTNHLTRVGLGTAEKCYPSGSTLNSVAEI